MGTALTTRTPPAVRWAPSVLRGPADADHYRVKVGRYGERWYQDGDNGPYPSITTVKKASGSDWTYVALKRVSVADDDLATMHKLDPEVRYARLKTINDFGLKTAGGRGTIVHWWMEDMLTEGHMRTVTPAMLQAAGIPVGALGEALTYQAAIGAFFDAYQPEVIAAEMVVIHKTLNGVGYGGTADVVLRIDGDVVYGDWKSRGASSDHSAYPEEGAQIAAASGAEYMIVANETDVDRIPPPKAKCGLVVSIKPDGCRLYPVDLDRGFEHFTAMHAWWVARKAEREPIGRAWPPRKAFTIDVASPGDATGTETPPLEQDALVPVTSVAVPDIAVTDPVPVAGEPDTAGCGAPPAPAASDDFPTYAPKGAACDTTSTSPARTATTASSSSPPSDSAATSAAPETTEPSSPTTNCSGSPSKSRRTTSPNSDSSSTPTTTPTGTKGATDEPASVQRSDTTVDERAAAPLGEVGVEGEDSAGLEGAEVLTDLTEPISEEIKAAADAEHRARMIRADSNPADKAAADQLVAAVKQSEFRDLISQWVTEGNRAGVPWSVRAARTVVNFERLRMALALAEVLDGDETLAELVLDRVALGWVIDTIGEHIGRVSVEECIDTHAYLSRIGDDIAVRYLDNGRPALVTR
jgi:hypothetical protein